MRVLGLFTGFRSWEKPFIENGDNVFMTDINKDYTYCNYIGDLRNINIDEIVSQLGGVPDIIVASPPCTTFSIASCSHHWHPPTKEGLRVPKSDNAIIGLELLDKTLELIELFNPQFWIIENPRGLMRKMKSLEGINRKTIWYCQYSDLRAKPTDLWGVWPKSFIPRKECKNHTFKNGVKVSTHCTHEVARRGAKTGTQGLKNNALRSVIPFELCQDWFNSCKSDFKR